MFAYKLSFFPPFLSVPTAYGIIPSLPHLCPGFDASEAMHVVFNDAGGDGKRSRRVSEASRRVRRSSTVA